MSGTRTVLDGLAFGEGPRWHDGALHLSDMHSYRVLRVEGTGATTVLQHTSPVSGIGWLPDGRLLAVAMEGEVLRLDPGGVVVHADVRVAAPFGVNDMITHPGGWSYIGQFGYDRHAEPRQMPQPSPLLRVDANGDVGVAAEDLLVANGMALTPDGATLLVAESAGGRITSFAIGAHGELSNRAVWASLPEGDAPDGMCIDTEDSAWFAAVTAGAFVRVRRGGDVLERIAVDEGRHAIACVLGGADRRTLFMLTATTFGEEDLSRERMDARVTAIEVAVPGAGRP